MCLPVSAQKKDKQFTVVFYNVENLFDIIDEPGKKDEEFTPGSAKQWSEERYEKKLGNLARVLSSISQDELPEIIGICEAENRTVLEDLINDRQLKKGDYGIVHEESNDIRGIDVALLYRKGLFTIGSHDMVSVSLPFDSSVTMRNILHVEGKADNRETIHFFVNHWTSRSDGEQASEPMRLYTAIALRKAVDGILNKDNGAKVIILGDFNDEPTSRSIFEMLYANNKRKNTSSRELYNLMFDMHNNDLENDTGTYSYRGHWNMLDQIIVSQQVIKDQTGYHTDYDGGRIFKQEWMLYFDQNLLVGLPDRTYGGDVYYGGFSDHLPVYMVLRRK
ncbi:MAG: hypothetical protein A2Y87_04290 [Bacteroidetes bacterium RBG_13_46_8]|nr:MAG: hypothetical protein A2Y87_04290 [Bacteroidetes bacterium RBG_13_46_8]